MPLPGAVTYHQPDPVVEHIKPAVERRQARLAHGRARAYPLKALRVTSIHRHAPSRPRRWIERRAACADHAAVLAATKRAQGSTSVAEAASRLVEAHASPGAVQPAGRFGKPSAPRNSHGPTLTPLPLDARTVAKGTLALHAPVVT